MKKILLKIKNFFLKLVPTKRRLIQLYSALLYNANLKGFITGDIFKGSSKAVCVPGFNCYSCPGAVGACPLGSLQNALSASKTKYPTYVIGIILLYAIIFGRTICGWLCPVGLLQELLYKIKTPKLKKSKVTRILSYFKYVLLVVLVIAVPLIYGLAKNDLPIPGFCKYICPAGTFEGAIFLLINPNNTDYFGMLGGLFTWKFALLIGFIVAAIFIYRFFCRFFCPLGALYGFFNKLSILGIKVDKSKCISCGKCIDVCKMDVKEVGDHECINCGECKKACPVSCINWKVVDKLVKEKVTEGEEVQEDVKSKRISKQAILNIVTSVILTGLLVFVIIYANFTGKKRIEINDVCSELNITLIDDQKLDLMASDDANLIYFYETFDLLTVQNLLNYSMEGLTITMVSNYVNWEVNKEEIAKLPQAINQNVYYGYDNRESSAVKTFVQEPEYPCFVYLDQNDKLLIKQNTMITEEVYMGNIYPSVSGQSVGNKVGDICLSQSLQMVGSEDKFSLLNNRGKVVVLNFWYTGCGPCVAELPYFNTLAETYQDDVMVVAVHSADEAVYTGTTDIETFLTGRGWDSWQVKFAVDDVKSSYIKALGGGDAFPMTVIVDQKGVIALSKVGPLSENDLFNKVQELLRK